MNCWSWWHVCQKWQLFGISCDLAYRDSFCHLYLQFCNWIWFGLPVCRLTFLPVCLCAVGSLLVVQEFRRQLGPANLQHLITRIPQNVIHPPYRQYTYFFLLVCENYLVSTFWTRMWASAQRDGRPAEHKWRPLFNAAKFSWRPLLDAVQ